MIGYEKDGTDHDETVYRVLKQCQDVNLKLNKEKCHFRCTSIPFLGGSVKTGCPTRPTKGQSPDRNAGGQKQKGTTGLSRHN